MLSNNQIKYLLLIQFFILNLNTIKCNDQNGTTVENETLPITTPTSKTMANNPTISSLVSLNSKINATTTRPQYSGKQEFISIIDGLLLVSSNLFLFPAIYISIKGQFRAEAIVYSLTMIFSVMYHLCDCEGFNYCILPYDMLQFADFFGATLTLWCTAIIISNVPYRWISSFHLTGAILYATLLHYFMTATWSFIIPALSTIILVGSYWGYRYYREQCIPEMIYTSNFYAAIGLMVLGSIMFASQTMFYFRRLYGISHSIWHITMSLAIALLLPRYPNIDSFWQDNLKIHSINESSSIKPPIIKIANDHPNNNVTMINSKTMPSNEANFSAHLNKPFTGGPI